MANRRKKFKIIDISKNTNSHLKKINMKSDWFDENSVVIGDDQIILGFYKNKKIKRIALLHELGHCLDRRNHRNNYYSELEAWRIARLLAKKLGIDFGGDEKRYMRECIKTYKKK